MINWIKSLFCKHDYREVVFKPLVTSEKHGNVTLLYGQRTLKICQKCDHSK